MRPNGKENSSKGRVERFYATEVKGKSIKRVRRVVLRVRTRWEG
ncbi:hypothetical protein QE429_000434 [Bacillus sp. SORGH_AS 510]|nr:hypothetical protein [Bacillus sp. SORGH_AS_0510]